MKDILERNGIFLSDSAVEKLEVFRRILLDYNEKFNLTAITDEKEIAVKHFADSIKGLKFLPGKGKIIDLGSGAGFPSVPLIIAGENEEREFVLLDSLKKRVDYLNDVIRELKLPKAVAVHERAEDEGKKSRGKYDCVVARAVAPLNVLLEYAMPVLKVGGTLVAYKGQAEEEIEKAQNALKILRAKIKTVEKYELDGEHKRSFVIVEKVGETPVKYPRGQNKPRSQPL